MNQTTEANKFTATAQKGKPGHCYAAQVFGPDGKSVAHVDPTEDPSDATVLAGVIAGALNYWTELKKLKP